MISEGMQWFIFVFGGGSLLMLTLATINTIAELIVQAFRNRNRTNL